MEQAKKRKALQGPPGVDQKTEIKDLTSQIPPVDGILNKIDEAAKQEVVKPKPKQADNCCMELLRDCCMDD